MKIIINIVLRSTATYYSAIYRNFKAIETEPYSQRAVIRFYEAHESKIYNLEAHESFEMVVAYNESLFDIGAYAKHLIMCDEVIRIAMQENIYEFGGVDIYTHTLFCKAQSFFHLLEFEQAIFILKKLIKIAPQNKDYASWLKQSYLKQQPPYLKRFKAIFIFTNLAIAFVIAAQIMVISVFFPALEVWSDIVRNSLIAIAIVSYTFPFVLHGQQSRKKVEKTVDLAKNKN